MGYIDTVEMPPGRPACAWQQGHVRKTGEEKPAEAGAALRGVRPQSRHSAFCLATARSSHASRFPIQKPNAQARKMAAETAA